MAKKKKSKLGSTKRYGPRYGRTIKEKAEALEAEKRKKTVCPFCSRQKVKRVSAGIWNCLNCNAIFAGKAYTPGKKVQPLQITGTDSIQIDDTEFEFYSKKPKKEQPKAEELEEVPVEE